MSDEHAPPQPRQIVHSLPAVCATCQQPIFVEQIVETVVTETLQPDGSREQTFDRRRVVQGYFWQPVDEDGAPTGPSYPFCPYHTTDPILSDLEV